MSDLNTKVSCGLVLRGTVKQFDELKQNAVEEVGMDVVYQTTKVDKKLVVIEKEQFESLKREAGKGGDFNEG